MTTFDPVAVITTATTAVGTQLTSVAGIGLGVGVGLFVLRKGWSLLRGFAS